MKAAPAPAMPAEQAADLAALQAAADDAPPVPGTPEASEAPPPADLAKELTGLIGVAVATLSPMFPSLKDTYTPETTAAAAGAIAAVCDKHGWFQGGMLGEWGPEIACALIVGPLALATYQGINADLQDMRAKKRKPDQIEGPNLTAQPPAGAVGSKTVSFGAGVPVEA